MYKLLSMVHAFPDLATVCGYQYRYSVIPGRALLLHALCLQYGTHGVAVNFDRMTRARSALACSHLLWLFSAASVSDDVSVDDNGECAVLRKVCVSDGALHMRTAFAPALLLLAAQLPARGRTLRRSPGA